MTRPGAAWIAFVEALPLTARLTGASVTWTLSTLGVVAGVASCARQRMPCTVSRKLRASLGEESVTGK